MARSSDYFDGSAPAEDMGAMEEHLRDCASCMRYKAVYEQGTCLLRDLPEPEIGEDFEPRLRHRLFHVDDHRALIDNSGSAAPALSVLSLAVLLTAVAWSPLLRSDGPVVDLAPIVVDDVRESAPAQPHSGSFGITFASSSTFGAIHRGLWDNARLYEYTRLSKRYRQDRALHRVGFDRE